MIEITDALIPHVCEGVKARHESYGLLIVSKRTPILNLNEDSTILWNAIDGRKKLFEIVNEMNSEIEEGVEKNRNIIMEFYKSCYELGLIEFK